MKLDRFGAVLLLLPLLPIGWCGVTLTTKANDAPGSKDNPQSGSAAGLVAPADQRPRIIIETDAGGDPDDEQSLVRFLLYANEWDVEGIIANRAVSRERENLNAERTGLGIVRALLNAYGECYQRLSQHDPRYPTRDQLWARTVAGYEDRAEGVELILTAMARPDPRPIWFCNWGTDHGSGPSNLKRALDHILQEQGRSAYARFKNRIRLSSADAFGEHTAQLDPPWVLWVDTFRPEIGGKRWYHRFSALTSKAAGFDVERDVRTGHGPLGALYPTNTTHPQKEGDTMAFLYLAPTGMNDVNEPQWGSWAGRYGRNETLAKAPYYWANQVDAWHGTTNRDNTLARWAADLQNDFRARLDWCVQDFAHANHAPVPVVNGKAGKSVVRLRASAEGQQAHALELNAAESSDPDAHQLRFQWWIYPEAGTYRGHVPNIEDAESAIARIRVPSDLGDRELHVVLTVHDQGSPPLASYRRVIIRAER